MTATTGNASTMPPRARTGSARDDSDPHAEYRTVQIRIRLRIFPPDRRDFRRGRTRTPTSSGDVRERENRNRRNHRDRRARANTRRFDRRARRFIVRNVRNVRNARRRAGRVPEGRRRFFPPRIRTRRRRARFIKTWEAARICFGCRTPPEETTRFPPGTRFLHWTRFQPGAGTRGFPPGTRFLRGTGFPPGTGFPRRTRTRLDGSPSRVAARARTSSIRLLSVQFPPVPGSTPRFSTW